MEIHTNSHNQNSYEIFLRNKRGHKRPVNLHPLFLFWKHGSVCDPKKNQVQNMDLKKVGCKKQGHCYSKREETRLPLLFLNNNDPFFCNLFWTSYFFQGHKPTHVFKTRIVGADWLREWVKTFLKSIVLYKYISNSQYNYKTI